MKMLLLIGGGELPISMPYFVGKTYNPPEHHTANMCTVTTANGTKISYKTKEAL
jgi:hypothetical protein